MAEFVTIFTDASLCHSTHACGWAVWIKHSNPPQTLRYSGSVENVRNSTEAELIALEKAAEFLLQKCLVAGRILVFQSDSMGALKKFDAWLHLHQAENISKKHVRGHQGLKCPRSAVNTWCDHQAKKKMKQLRKRLQQEGENHGETATQTV